MDRIENAAQLEEWLKDKSYEVSRVCYMRAGLRAAPRVVRTVDRLSVKERGAVVLSVFRALAAAWTISAWPKRRTEVTNSAAAATAFSSAAEGPAFGAAFSAVVDADAYASTYTDVGLSIHADVAAAAAYAVANATDTDDIVAYWMAVEFDIVLLEQLLAQDGDADEAARRAASSLARTPLWQKTVPRVLVNDWNELRNQLLDADEGWDVWTDWYEARLRAGPTTQALEVARVLIRDADWRHGPVHVNELIAELERKHAPEPSDSPELPKSLPSPVSFEIRDGAVHKVSHPSPAPPDERRAAAETAWRSLKELLADLAESSAGQNNPRIGRVLDHCSAAFGYEFQQLDIVMLGVHASVLEYMAQRADEFLMPADAATVMAFNSQLGLFLGQFPEWSEYARGVAGRFGSDEAERQAVSDASGALRAIREDSPDLLAPDAVGVLVSLEDDATPVANSDQGESIASLTGRRSFLRGIRNLLLTLSRAACRGLEHGVETHVKAMTLNALAAASTWLISLLTVLTAEFAWLSGVVAYATRIVTASFRGRRNTGNDDISDG